MSTGHDTPSTPCCYRVFAQHFERFVQVYDERFAPRRGPLPAGAHEAVNRYLDCGIFACGYERALLGDLAGCAWRALRLWVLAYFEDDSAVPGAVGFIQTAGELLNFHPHVHLLVTDGVFARRVLFRVDPAIQGRNRRQRKMQANRCELRP